VVRDRRKNVQLVEQYLNELRLSLNRQVIIEAKIIQVSLNQGHQFGIDWNYLNKTLDGGEGSILFGTGLGVKDINPFGNTVNWVVNSGKNIEMRFFMDALSTYGTANVLSSPRMNVINNQTAMISVGRTIPWQQFELRSLTTESGLSTSDLVPTVVFSSVGVTLGITPQISEEGETMLHIVPIVTDFVEFKQFEYQEAAWEVPILDVREADTIVKVPDGATIIIGGLIQEKTRDNTSKIPFLGDIPGLGKAFQNQNKSTEKVELVIMLTPTVIKR